MSSSGIRDADVQPWSSAPSADIVEPTVESALEKERVLRDIVTLRDGLRGLSVRITEVDSENDKLTRDNEMLSVYIDNLTRKSVVAAGTKR
ncbi:hypothetical protein IAR55_005494 [Kwoniella newhampshirensis]|uniref:Short coiled-coil protein n=1 Tax=Kwoniella newhampshirensis TaxID=1651941 RepID=A0AAW0YHN5_9TREE